MRLIRSTITYLCPKMIHFDAVNFSEWRCKEVMFLAFFWHSVYYIRGVNPFFGLGARLYRLYRSIWGRSARGKLENCVCIVMFSVLNSTLCSALQCFLNLLCITSFEFLSCWNYLGAKQYVCAPPVFSLEGWLPPPPPPQDWCLCFI